MLYTTTLFLFRHRDPSPVSFLYRRDSIAQEAEETFILTIATTANLTEYTTRLVLHGTILDDDSELNFGLESRYLFLPSLGS